MANAAFAYEHGLGRHRRRSSPKARCRQCGFRKRAERHRANCNLDYRRAAFFVSIWLAFDARPVPPTDRRDALFRTLPLPVAPAVWNGRIPLHRHCDPGSPVAPCRASPCSRGSFQRLPGPTWLDGRKYCDAVRWEPERPDEKSLWLLPSGSDQVGDDAVRPTPRRPYGETCPLWQASAWIAAKRKGRSRSPALPYPFVGTALISARAPSASDGLPCADAARPWRPRPRPPGRAEAPACRAGHAPSRDRGSAG